MAQSRGATPDLMQRSSSRQLSLVRAVERIRRVWRHTARSGQALGVFQCLVFNAERLLSRGRNVSKGSRLCENVSASFWGVNFSHVDAISDEFSRPIRLLAILRGERNEFSHSLDPERKSEFLQSGHRSQ